MFVGVEAIIRFYKDIRLIRDGKHTIAKIIIEDKWGSSLGTFSGQLRDSRKMAVAFSDHYTFEDGLIYERITYFFAPVV